MSISSTFRKLFGGDSESRAMNDYRAKLNALEESQKNARTEIEAYRLQLDELARKIERKRQEYEAAVGAQKDLLKRELAALFDEQKKSKSKQDATFKKIEQNNTLISNLETLLAQGGGASVDDIESILDDVEDQESKTKEIDRAMNAFEKKVVGSTSFESIDVDAELAKLAAQTASVQAAAADEVKTALPSVDELEAELAQTCQANESEQLCE